RGTPTRTKAPGSRTSRRSAPRTTTRRSSPERKTSLVRRFLRMRNKRRTRDRGALWERDSVGGAGAVAAERTGDRDREHDQAVENRGGNRIVDGPHVLRHRRDR